MKPYRWKQINQWDIPREEYYRQYIDVDTGHGSTGDI